MQTGRSPTNDRRQTRPEVGDPMNKLKEQAQDKAFEARRMIRKADDEHRELVEEERQKIEKLLDEADKLREDAKAQDEAVKAFGGERTLTHGGDPNAVQGQGWEALGKSVDGRQDEGRGPARGADASARPARSPTTRTSRRSAGPRSSHPSTSGICIRPCPPRRSARRFRSPSFGKSVARRSQAATCCAIQPTSPRRPRST